MAEENLDIQFFEDALKDIDQRFIKQLDSAHSSIDKGNPEYAVGVCSTILQKYPACLDVRKILRIAQRKFVGKLNVVAQISSSINGSLFAMKAKSMIKKGDALKVLSDGETLLKVNPYNAQVLKAMAIAAESLNYWSTAAFLYQNIVDIYPTNKKIMLAMGDAYLKCRKADEALRVGDAMLKQDAGNGDAQALMRSASVIKTMDKGKWEDQDSDFKSKIKSADESIDLEKAGRLMNDEDTLLHMVERLKLQINDDPENINLYKEIVGSYRTLKKYDEALEFIGKARQLSMGKADTSLEKLEHDLNLASMTMKIEQMNKELESNPDNNELKKSLEEMKSKEHSYRLKNAKGMVDKYPNDYNFRFIYGTLLFEDGRLDDAIAQFQLSQRSPKVRLQSLLGLGKSFMAGKKYDLAVDQFTTAKSESQLMNDSKKEIIYELGRAYELMGKPDKAFNEYKEIYQSDIGFRDVSQKINEYYAKKNS